jgi:predicted SprT family Zn-dependent metalloprotease
MIQLLSLFQEINLLHFDSFLDPPALSWNPRLRASAGRFIPGSRKFWRAFPPRIEVASYLLEEANAPVLVKDTMAHEMIHYWLWVRRSAYGHTPEFLAKMRLMGVNRYNSVPRTRPFKYLYECAFCDRNFPARRKLGPLACASCCAEHSAGQYDPRFKLILSRMIDPSEPFELPT